MRTSRSNGTITYKYVYNGDKLSQMTILTKNEDDTVSEEVVNLAYDASGLPFTLTYTAGGATESTTYYYITNIQGDVVGLTDSEGTLLISYSYEAYGEGYYSSYGTQSALLARINPLCYRGYVYDTGTNLYYLQSRYYDPTLGRFLNTDCLIAGLNGSVNGYNLFAYCMNNPLNMADSSGNWPKWIENAVNWVDENIVQPVKKVINKLSDDINNYDKGNSDIDIVYESNYFSSYNNTLVIRHSSEFLTSWASGGIIYLNHDNDGRTNRDKTLKHEYGHILQEEELGAIDYVRQVFIPSATYNLLSRCIPTLNTYYYSMPWEYDADMRGGVDRTHASWSGIASELYFILWEL